MSNSENKAKTLVIGDMHLKEDLILSRVDQAIKKLDVNRVVFCGDYVDEWHSNRSIMLDAIDDFLTWIDGKRKHGLDVDFVLGNHDMQYLRGIPGPGTHTDLYKEVFGRAYLYEGSDGMRCGQLCSNTRGHNKGVGLSLSYVRPKGNSLYAFRCSQ